MSWLRKNVGNVLTGIGSVLAVSVPPLGIVAGAAGKVVNNIQANKEPTLYPKFQKLFDKIKTSPEYIKTLSQAEISEPVSPDQDPGGGFLSGINPLYLFAGALLIIVLLFKK